MATDRRKERQGDELNGSLASPMSNAMWDIHRDIIAVTNNNCGNSKSVTVEDLCDRPCGNSNTSSLGDSNGWFRRSLLSPLLAQVTVFFYLERRSREDRRKLTRSKTLDLFTPTR